MQHHYCENGTEILRIARGRFYDSLKSKIAVEPLLRTPSVCAQQNFQTIYPVFFISYSKPEIIPKLRLSN